MIIRINKTSRTPIEELPINQYSEYLFKTKCRYVRFNPFFIANNGLLYYKPTIIINDINFSNIKTFAIRNFKKSTASMFFAFISPKRNETIFAGSFIVGPIMNKNEIPKEPFKVIDRQVVFYQPKDIVLRVSYLQTFNSNDYKEYKSYFLKNVEDEEFMQEKLIKNMLSTITIDVSIYTKRI